LAPYRRQLRSTRQLGTWCFEQLRMRQGIDVNQARDVRVTQAELEPLIFAAFNAGVRRGRALRNAELAIALDLNTDLEMTIALPPLRVTPLGNPHSFEPHAPQPAPLGFRAIDREPGAPAFIRRELAAAQVVDEGRSRRSRTDRKP
jgi:hypothetical protein